MKRIFHVIALYLLLSCMYFITCASGAVHTKLGIVAGINYPIISLESSCAELSLKPKVGFRGGLSFNLDFHKNFYSRAEVLFNFTRITISDTQHHFSSQLKSTSIQIPLLIGAHFGAFHIFAGPQFNVLDDPKYDVLGERTLFGRIYPTVSYTAGLAILFFKRLSVEVRYNGLFNKLSNNYSYSLKHSEEIKTKCNGLSIGLGFQF
ncbi:MAG: PorT family protein [Alistipes sp.]|nr:PorT family protein [Candidatus Alistipes equi]